MKPVERLRQGFFRWALRGPSPEASPIVLGQRRVFVLPTRFGFAFAVLLLVMLIAAINYNLSLGYALVFLLAGLGLMAILHSFRNLAHLRIAPGRVEAVFAGEKACFRLNLANPGNKDKVAIRLSLPGLSPVEIDVPANGSIEAGLELPAECRGWLDLPRLTLETRYPLGLIRAWAYAAPRHRCLVYPAPAEDAAPLPTAPGEETGNAGAQAGMEDFAGLRTHQSAESLRHVAWKVAARMEQGPLMSKRFDGGAAQLLMLDWDDLPYELGLEQRLSVLARWVCTAAEAGILWGLRLPGARFPPAKGDAHYHACLKALALYEKKP